MRTTTQRLLLLAAAAASVASGTAQAQQHATPSAGAGVEVDPCTGKPRRAANEQAPGASAAQAQPGTQRVQPGAAPRDTAPWLPAPGTASAATRAEGENPSGGAYSGTSAAAQPSGGTEAAAQTQPAQASGTSAAWSDQADSVTARRNRSALRLGRGRITNQVRLGPAASVSVPTAFGVDAGELFIGAAYQQRTRYTEEDDAALVAGFGIGTRQTVALEVALTSYSTLRGAPLETGGLSFKLHRALPRSTSVAVGWENALLWGGSDDRGSLYAVATRVVTLREQPSQRFDVAVFTLGIGNGRFRFEDDDAADKKTVNVFAAAGVRVLEPLSLVADWTGQDLNLAASLTPIRRVPLVLTTGVADLTGGAGDGARFILSLGYGLAIRQPF